MLTKHSVTDSSSHLGGAPVEVIDGALDSGNSAHGVPIQQTCLQCTRKLACVQAVQNLLHMKSIGDQVRDYRTGKGLNTAQFAQLVGKKRQHIEQLEAAGNRIPKYLGDLAAVMGTTSDEMLATAGLSKAAPRPPREPSTEPKGSVFTAPTPDELELLSYWRLLLGSDRRSKLKDIAKLAKQRQAEREELFAEAGLTAIAAKAALASRRRRDGTTVEVAKRPRQRSPLDESERK